MERYEKRRAAFDAQAVRIAGVSVDPIEVSQDLANRLELGFPILADEKGEMAKAYGVWHAQKRIALPAIVIVGPKGFVRWRRVSHSVSDRPDEDEVLEVVKRLPR